VIVEGRARVFGDDVNTDYIISSRRKRETIDEAVLKLYLFESIAPEFAASIQPDDLIVAGGNFGCGSAMEIAVTVIRAAGIRAVIARSFARSFYRNAINNGLLAVQCETSSIRESDRLRIASAASVMTVQNVTREDIMPAAPMPAIMLRILEEGGLVGFLSKYGAFR
jgi:3-isopropylmalate/(R)-2-methylmalate dehydratase small subunit